ncbi:hypothetical protein ACLOJK_018750 [Asimina triloba]
MDYFTKWAEAVAYKQVLAKEVTKFIKHKIVYRYDVPYQITSDNNTQFKNNKTEKLHESVITDLEASTRDLTDHSFSSTGRQQPSISAHQTSIIADRLRCSFVFFKMAAAAFRSDSSMKSGSREKPICSASPILERQRWCLQIGQQIDHRLKHPSRLGRACRNPSKNRCLTSNLLHHRQ